MKNPLRRQTSLNHARLKPEDIGNLKLREQLLEAQRITAEQARLVLMMMENENEAFRKSMLNKYSLRKGKNFLFNLQYGYIHRPKTTPWEKQAKPVKPKVKDLIIKQDQVNGNLPSGIEEAVKNATGQMKEEHVHTADCGHDMGYDPNAKKSNEVEGVPV